jgi:hypothetical protein
MKLTTGLSVVFNNLGAIYVAKDPQQAGVRQQLKELNSTSPTGAKEINAIRTKRC